MNSGVLSTDVKKCTGILKNIEKKIINTPTSWFNSVLYTEVISPPLFRPKILVWPLGALPRPLS
jgi:hypothetical protein